MRFRLLGRLLAAQALSSLGTSVSSIALAFMVYELTGSVLHMGGVLAVTTFPLVVTSFVGGALLDRYSARTLMVLADLGRAVLIFMLPFLAQEAVGLIYLVSVLMGVMSAVFNPGQIKVVAELTEERYLVRANSYLGVSRDGAELVGYLVGGVLVAYFGYVLTFAIDAGSYLLSALLLLGLPRVAPGTASTGEDAASGAGPAVAPAESAAPPAESVAPPNLWALLAEAPGVLAEIWHRPQLRTNLLLGVFANLAVIMSVPNTYGLALQVFDAGAEGLAALEVVTASGLILGGLLISRLRLRGDKNRYGVTGLVGMGLCFAAVSASPVFWLSAALLGVAGMLNVAVFGPSITMFQEIPDRARRGRLIAVRAGFGQMGVTGGYLLGGALGARLGITQLFLMAGSAGIVLALGIYLPHKVVAQRRARSAFYQATQQGLTRVRARELADHAALVGSRSWPGVASAALASEAVDAAQGPEVVFTVDGPPEVRE